MAVFVGCYARFQFFDSFDSSINTRSAFSYCYICCLKQIIDSGKAFLSSFIRRINIKDSEAEIEYACPIGLGGSRRNEVLSMGCIGSRGRTRTYNHTVNSRVLYH